MSTIHKYFSKKTRKNTFIQAIKEELKQFWFSVCFAFSSYKKGLEQPERDIPWNVKNWSSLAEDYEISKSMFDRSEDRYNRLEEKAHKMFGVATFFIPLVLAVFAYVIEHYTSTSIYLAMLFSLFFYLLSLWCCLRAIQVKERQAPGLALLIDPSTDQMLSPKKEQIIACYLYCSQHNEILNDHVANFVRSAESFIFIAISLTILSGGFSLNYRLSFNSKEKTQAEIVSEAINKSLIPLQGISNNLSRYNENQTLEIESLKSRMKILEKNQIITEEDAVGRSAKCTSH